MNYTIDLSEDKRFLVMKAAGDFTIDIVRQWSVEIAERGRELNIRRFLFDVRLARNACTILENYNHAYRDADDLQLLKDIRSAILTSEGDRSHDFVEITFRNAGIDVKLFTDESSAVKWLEEEFC